MHVCINVIWQACICKHVTVALFFAGDVLGLICYLDARAICSGRTADIPGDLSPQNIRECCINRNGFALNSRSGDEDCLECIGKKSHYTSLDIEL